MMTYVKPLIVVSALIVLGACSIIPEAAFTNRGDPENLIDVSIEHVTVPLDHAQGIDDLITWLGQSQPARAVLQCAVQDMLCVNAKRTLVDFAVPVSEQSSAGGNQVILEYETLLVRDCNQRYQAMPHNAYNLNQPSFGCSVVGNTLKMVTDKRNL